MQAEFGAVRKPLRAIAEQEEQAPRPWPELNAVQSELAELTTASYAMQAELDRSESLAAQIAVQESVPQRCRRRSRR